MIASLKTLLGVKFKILIRNNFGKNKKLKSWVVLIFGFLLFFIAAKAFQSSSIIVLILIFKVISIINNHSNKDQSWVNSILLYPTYPKVSLSVGINVFSDIIMKLVLIWPFFLWFDYSVSIIELLLIFCCVIINIISSFFLTELVFKDLKFKKLSRVPLFVYICLFAFFGSSAFNLETLKVESDFFFLALLIKYSTEALLIMVSIHVAMLLYLGMLYFKKYHHQIAVYED